MRLIIYILSAFLISIITSCYKTEGFEPGYGLEDWTDATHGGDASPNYSVVFPTNEVNRIDITISPENWQLMQDDLDYLFASAGGGPGPNFPEEDPIYVPCTLSHSGKDWYYVGIRYKGNSSLATPYQQGISKLPLRLDFDKFEDNYPQVWDQTFYGFNELSLSNNFNDPSFIRQKCADDVLREFGVPATRSSFCRIYIDYGDGPIYFGLYTMVEVVFDTFLSSWFGNEEGNCYKPEDESAKFELGTFVAESIEKKTNEAQADWSDLQTLYDILHDNSRVTNPSVWKSSLESAFDIDGFLRWLAANTTFQNWDTYGNAPHNFYLYNDPADGRISWIPWDHNSSFKGSGNGPTTPHSFEMTEFGTEWPLIAYILAESSFRATYDGHIEDFLNGPFEIGDMTSKIQNYYNLIYDYTVGVNGEQAGYTFLSSPAEFNAEINDLITHVSNRHIDASNYLQ